MTSRIAATMSGTVEGLELREGGRQVEHAARHADGHGQHVVSEKRRGRDQARDHAQVLVGHDVAAAALGIGADRLPVGEGHQEQQADDQERDRHQVRKSHRADREQREHARLGRVGDRAHHVAGEDGQCLPLRQALLKLLVRREDPPEHEPPRVIAEARGTAVRLDGGDLGDERALGPVPEVAGLRPVDHRPAVAELLAPLEMGASRAPLVRSTSAHDDAALATGCAPVTSRSTPQRPASGRSARTCRAASGTLATITSG